MADLARAALSAPDLYGEPPVRRAAPYCLHRELAWAAGAARTAARCGAAMPLRMCFMGSSLSS